MQRGCNSLSPHHFPEDYCINLEDNFFGGLTNLPLSPNSCDLGDGIAVTKTYAHLMAPFIVAFQPASEGKRHPGPWKASSGGFGFDVVAELSIPSTIGEKYGTPISIASSIVFLIRLGVSPEITMPVVSNCSFSDLKDIPDQEANIYPYEVQPRYFRLLVSNVHADHEALQWVKERWKTVIELKNESPEFALAVKAIDAGQFVQNTGLIMVSLWGALEALFSPSNSELRFRVSSLIAAFLYEAGSQRAECQRKVAKLYDKRSAAAHGKPKHRSDDVLESFELLRTVLFKIIDDGKVPKKSQLEGRLFGADE